MRNPREILRGYYMGGLTGPIPPKPSLLARVVRWIKARFRK